MNSGLKLQTGICCTFKIKSVQHTYNSNLDLFMLVFYVKLNTVLCHKDSWFPNRFEQFLTKAFDSQASEPTCLNPIYNIQLSYFYSFQCVLTQIPCVRTVLSSHLVTVWRGSVQTGR